jgi:hypothetical protein
MPPKNGLDWLPPGLTEREELPPGLKVRLEKSGVLPPGLAKREELPPGLEKQLDNTGSLPPGLAKRLPDSNLDLDIVVGNFLDPNQLIINEGGVQGGITGNFASVIELPGGSTRVSSVSLGDIDGDGDLDILVANDLQPNRLLVNQGGNQAGEEGDFAFGPELPGGALESREIALADIDRDGDLDALIANSGDPSQPTQSLINQGGAQGSTEGDLVLGPNLPGPGSDNSWNIATGDVDGDGDLDAVVSNLFEPNRLLINQGGLQGGTEGQFGLGPNLPGGVRQTREIALGDIDGDGDLDALVANSNVGFNVNQVIINQGGLQGATEGQFQLGPNLPGDTNQRSAGVALGDIDSDGDLDAILINSFDPDAGAPNVLLINQGGMQGGTEGSFQLGPELPGGSLVTADVLFGDVDADLDLDVLLVNRSGIGLDRIDQLLINQGGLQNGQEGTFALGEELPGDPSSGRAGAFGDVDGDGAAPTLTVSGLPYVGLDDLLPYAAEPDYFVG